MRMNVVGMHDGQRDARTDGMSKRLRKRNSCLYNVPMLEDNGQRDLLLLVTRSERNMSIIGGRGVVGVGAVVVVLLFNQGHNGSKRQ